jgi:hypothetical protein
MSGVNDAAQVRRQVWLMIAVVAALYGLFRLAIGPLPQDLAYHLFADTRAGWGGVPHVANIVSNIPILLAGLLGLMLRPRMTIAPEERAAVSVLIAASTLTAFGSAYYHWAPANASLVWDRLPIAIVLMSLLALVMADRLHPLFARVALWPFVALGVASVVLWGVSEAMGQGDLLLYLIVRVGAGAAIAFLLILRQPRYTGAIWLVAAIIAEIVMALFEVLDHEVFRLTGGLASGHSLKHVVAGVGLACVFGWLRARTARYD